MSVKYLRTYRSIVVTDVSDNISQTIPLWDNWQGKMQRNYFHILEFVLVFPSYLIHYDIKAIYIASCPIGKLHQGGSLISFP